MTTIFATITSPIRSSITVIRISGKQTLNCLKAIGCSQKIIPRKCFFHKIIDARKTNNSVSSANDEGFYSSQNNSELPEFKQNSNANDDVNDFVIDESLITFFQAPQSFTGEDVAEICVHSSPFIIKKISEILLSIEQVESAQGGEFSKRAFLNGKIDLVQAEAIPDLIASETEAQHRQAINQLQGKLGKIYENWRFKIIEISAMIEALIDFPEDDLPSEIMHKVESDVKTLISEIENHLHDNKVGQKIKNGLNLAIIGAPNVGKSSLINFLANSEVAIVSEIAGTTRDIVETHLQIAGVPVKISDTAGIRKSKNLIEQEGIRRALKKANEADIKILMTDASDPKIDSSLIDENTILVFNKIDKIDSITNSDQKTKLSKNKNFIDELKFISEKSAKQKNKSYQELDSIEHKKHSNYPKNLKIIRVSLINNINTEQLIQELEIKINQILPNQNLPFITQERYRATLQNCLKNLKTFSLKKNIELSAEDLRISAREIGKITGKVSIENILDLVFSSFCIGK